ncbi:MAG: carboxylesterase family protein, partial [Methanoregula sp.]|nr:carboxylesterase family protein [Methanoregula sp.]
MQWVISKKTGFFLSLSLVIIALLCAGCTQPQPATVPATPATVAPLSLFSPGSVQTDVGAVSGIATGAMRVYHNIPYAAPPVGELRWRPPAAAQPWTGVRDGTQFSASCPQPVTVDRKTGKPVISEDCLYL